MPALVGLVDKSVVLRDDADPSRYRFLAALREFGADRLALTSAPESQVDRLAARCVTMARQFDEGFRDGARLRGRADGSAGGTEANQVTTFRSVHADYENIRAVLCYTLDARQPSDAPPDALAVRRRLGAALATRLCGYWQISGLLDEGRQWLTTVAELFTEPTQERVWALCARGRLATFHGDLDAAIADLTESIGLAEAAGRGAELAAARGYLYLNLALALAGRHAEALAAAEVARARLLARGDKTGVAVLEAQLAYLCQLTGNVEEAVEHGDRGLALLGKPASGWADGERWVGGYLYLASGIALAKSPGRERASAMALRRALTAKHELGDVVGTAYAVEALAWVAAQGERYERAAWLIAAADQLWNRVGHRPSGVALLEDSRQRTIANARRALGELRFAAAYARGTGLEPDAVVREVGIEVGGVPGPRVGDVA
ncbi:MAG: hypothetical protein ACRDL8_10750, partial [Solirubrobacteraceae bacterium]